MIKAQAARGSTVFKHFPKRAIRPAFIGALALSQAFVFNDSSIADGSDDGPQNSLVFVWYPHQSEQPSARDCLDLLKRTNPSREKAQAWLWGRVPLTAELEHYLILSGDRMETTYAAEGDFDTGTVTWSTRSDTRAEFTLQPDDHPDVEIEGVIEFSNLPAVMVLLRGIPTLDGNDDRRTFYCRVPDELKT